MARRTLKSTAPNIKPTRRMSDGLVSVQRGPLHWHVLPRRHQSLFSGNGPEWTNLTGDPRIQLVKSNPLRRVYKATIDETEYYIKLYGQTNWRDAVKWRLRGVPAVREFENLQYAREKGVSVVPPVAWASGTLAGQKTGILVTHSVGPTVSLEDVLWKQRDEKPDDFDHILRESARLIALFHLADMEHGDLHTGNILILTQKQDMNDVFHGISGDNRTVLTDLQNCRIHRHGRYLRSGAYRRWRMHNFARLVGGIMDRIDRDLLSQFIDIYIQTLKEYHQNVPIDEPAKQSYFDDIVGLALQKQREFRRRRDRRAFRNSRYSSELKFDNGWRGWAFLTWRTPMDFSPASFMDFELDDWKNALNTPESLWIDAVTVERKTNVTTYYKKINVGERAVEVCIRHFTLPQSLRGFRLDSLPENALKWWKNAFRCIHREVSVPWPLATLTKSKYGIITEGIYIYEKLADAVSLAQMLNSRELSRKLKRSVAQSVGRLFGQCEKVGLVMHKCHKDGIVVNNTGVENFAYLSDLHGVGLRFWNGARWGKHKGMIKLGASIINNKQITNTDYLRFFEAYFSELVEKPLQSAEKKKYCKQLSNKILRQARSEDIPWLRGQEFRNILIIKPSSLGDIVRTLPVLHAMRRAYPEAKISWLVRPDLAGILTASSELDEIVEFDRRRFGRMGRDMRAAIQFFGFVNTLRKKRYDLVLDIQGLFRSGFLSFCTGAKYRVGFGNARELARIFYTHKINNVPDDEHVVLSNWRFAQAFGFGDEDLRFEIPVAPAAQQRAAAMLAEAGLCSGQEYAVLLVGGTTGSKCWPPERFARLADVIAEKEGLKCVLLGAGQREKTISNSVLLMARRDMINLVDQTSLEEMTAVLQGSRLVVGNDSGPLHVAATAGVATIGLYGPTNPEVVGPYGHLSRVVQAGASVKRQGRYSPRPEHAMEQISVAAVMEMVVREMPDAGRRPSVPRVS